MTENGCSLCRFCGQLKEPYDSESGHAACSLIYEDAVLTGQFRPRLGGVILPDTERRLPDGLQHELPQEGNDGNTDVHVSVFLCCHSELQTDIESGTLMSRLARLIELEVDSSAVVGEPMPARLSRGHISGGLRLVRSSHTMSQTDHCRLQCAVYKSPSNGPARTLLVVISKKRLSMERTSGRSLVGDPQTLVVGAQGLLSVHVHCPSRMELAAVSKRKDNPVKNRETIKLSAFFARGGIYHSKFELCRQSGDRRIVADETQELDVTVDVEVACGNRKLIFNLSSLYFMEEKSGCSHHDRFATETNNFGSFGTVYCGTGGQEMAIRRMECSRDCLSLQQFCCEILSRTWTNHDCIVRLTDFPMSDSDLYMLYECMPWSCLKSLLNDKESSLVLNWKIRLQIAKDLVEAVTFLAQRNLIHRDIKSSNVLISGNSRAKLGDFSNCVLSQHSCSPLVNMTDTDHLPPEAHRGKFSFKTDVFGVGIICFELAIGCPLLCSEISSILSTDQIPAWLMRTSNGKTFLCIAEAAVANNPESRPTAQKMLRMLNEVIVQRIGDGCCYICSASGDDVQCVYAVNPATSSLAPYLSEAIRETTELCLSADNCDELLAFYEDPHAQQASAARRPSIIGAAVQSLSQDSRQVFSSLRREGRNREATGGPTAATAMDTPIVLHTNPSTSVDVTSENPECGDLTIIQCPLYFRGCRWRDVGSKFQTHWRQCGVRASEQDKVQHLVLLDMMRSSLSECIQEIKDNELQPLVAHYDLVRIADRILYGSFTGTLFRASLHCGSENIGGFSLKYFSDEICCDTSATLCFSRELRYLSRLRHRNIMKLIGFSSDGPELCLVYQDRLLHTLRDRLDCKNHVDWRDLLRVSRDVSSAVEYLQRRQFIHGNVTTLSVYLTVDSEAKLAGFDYALGYLDGISTCWNIDVCSLGMILYEIATGLPPYCESTNQDLISYVRSLNDVTTILSSNPDWPKHALAVQLGREVLQLAHAATSYQSRLPIRAMCDTLRNICDRTI